MNSAVDAPSGMNDACDVGSCRQRFAMLSAPNSSESQSREQFSKVHQSAFAARIAANAKGGPGGLGCASGCEGRGAAGRHDRRNRRGDRRIFSAPQRHSAVQRRAGQGALSRRHLHLASTTKWCTAFPASAAEGRRHRQHRHRLQAARLVRRLGLHASGRPSYRRSATAARRHPRDCSIWPSN